jgi:hypothetical protein
LLELDEDLPRVLHKQSDGWERRHAHLADRDADHVRLVELAVGIAVDASGSVWTANSGDNTVSQFIGLATAVRTPLAIRYISF